MRGLNITFVAAIAGLAVAASACEDMPTQPDNQMGALEVATSNGQDRVTLCHRSNDGGYVKITVADAAYDTHMMHGDRDAGLDDACPEVWMSLLEVEVGEYPPNPRIGVSVMLHAFGGEPETFLPLCGVGTTCMYDVPVGSTVTLSPEDLAFFWDGETEPSSGTRIMDIHRTVFVSFDGI